MSKIQHWRGFQAINACKGASNGDLYSLRRMPTSPSASKYLLLIRKPMLGNAQYNVDFPRKVKNEMQQFSACASGDVNRNFGERIWRTAKLFFERIDMALV